jgi:poly-gamma-glutamate biosynthesis protein PgsC/CapC
MLTEVAIVGLLVSLAFIALTGFYPGGIIVPSYLVLFFGQPGRLVGTFVAALLALIVYRLASRRLILFGQRRLVFLLLAGALFSTLGVYVAPALLPAAVEYRVIGWIIPGLIANHCERQGVLLTGASLLTVTTLLYLGARLLGLLGG